MTRIIGIDPGSRITGYGVIDIVDRKTRYIASGCVRTKQEALPARLHEIFSAISAVVEEYQPDTMAVEDVFMSRNADSALKLGQARGAAICAGAQRQLPISEYTARQVKQALVGKGSADKSQVAHMVKILLGRKEALQADEADALAVALCHCHTAQTLSHIEGAQRMRRGRLR